MERLQQIELEVLKVRQKLCVKLKENLGEFY